MFELLPELIVKSLGLRLCHISVIVLLLTYIALAGVWSVTVPGDGVTFAAGGDMPGGSYAWGQAFTYMRRAVLTRASVMKALGFTAVLVLSLLVTGVPVWLSLCAPMAFMIVLTLVLLAAETNTRVAKMRRGAGV